MGVVWEALDRERGSHVAMKTIRDPAPGTLLRFKNEFRALHDLRHPNLVTLGELHEEDGQWFFTMELVDGVDLLSWVRGDDRPFDGRTPATQSFGLTPTEHVSRSSGVRSSERGARESDPNADPTSLPTIASSPSDPGVVRVASVPSGARISVEQPGAQRWEEKRLREALLQLARGLEALHRAKRVHRDVKPSNVMVGRDGRVVLLDFGLVEEIRASGCNEVEICGTAEYMAPEQAAGDPIGPEADWYAVGVLLYEILAGRFPFSGPAAAILVQKQMATPEPPSRYAANLPTDLEALCLSLLAIDPRERPTGAEIVVRLGRPSDVANVLADRETSFVGRARELEALEQAFHDGEVGRAVAIVVEGESGLGKSALVRCFVDRMRERDAALVLEGRCYERETVTYKAFDGVVDALARHLSRSGPSREPRDLEIPADAAILCEVFPVLGVVPELAAAKAAKNAIVDPAERRNRLFGAMRALFVHLASSRRVVLAIDDLQWADGDSVALLREIVREPNGAPLSIVATARPVTGAPPWDSLVGDLRTLRLGRLDAEDARTLAVAILGSARSEEVEYVVREASGHPLFLDALARETQSGMRSSSSGRGLRLDDALWARVEELDPETRALVEIVALTGAPIPQELARRAAAISAESFADRARLAWSHRLVRTGGPRLTDPIEPYHDRVRESVVAHLDVERKRALHQAILAVVRDSEVEPQLVAVHAFGAGDLELARRETLRAADRAFDALAFDRAAELYRRALSFDRAPELGVAKDEREVRIRLGDTLALAGRGRDAAAAYAEARTCPGVSRALGFELDRRIAEQLLFSGHLAEGKAALADVLARLGLRLAKTPLRAILMALLRRLWLRVVGYRYVIRERADIDAEKLVALDVLWTAVRGLMFIDFPRGIDFQTRYIVRVLRAGDRRHLANGFAAEASSSSTTGAAGLARSVGLFASMDEVSASIDDPAVHAHNHSHKGFAHFMAGDFREGRRAGELGAAMYAEHCLGVNWYLVAMRRYLIFSYYYLGDFLELQRKLKAWRTDAHRRGDLFAMANYSLGLANASWLIDDDVDGATEDVIRTFERWSISTKGEDFTMQHYQALFARTQIDLYAGAPKDAWNRIEGGWSTVKRSLFLRIRSIGIEGTHLRARAAIAYAATLETSERAAPLAIARRVAKSLEKDGLPWALGFAAAITAAIAELEGRREAALHALGQAEAHFASASMALYVAAARHRRGSLTDDAELVTTSERTMRTQGIARPDKLVRMMLPM